MNQHLGIGDVVAAAFRFGFERGLILIRLFWAPVIAIIGLEFALFALLGALGAANQTALASGSTTVFLALFYGVGIVISVLATFIVSGATAAYYRLAALGDEPVGAVFIRFDGPSVRTALAMIITTVIFYLTALAPVVSTVVVAAKIEWASWQGQFAHAAPRGLPASSLLAIFGSYFFGLLLTLYFGVRLSALAPMAAAENRLSLGRAWSLTSGKVLPMIGAYILVGLAAQLALVVGGLALITLNLAIAVLGGVFLGDAGGLEIAGFAFSGVLVVGFFFIVGATHMALPAIIYRRLAEIDAAEA